MQRSLLLLALLVWAAPSVQAQSLQAEPAGAFGFASPLPAPSTASSFADCSAGQELAQLAVTSAFAAGNTATSTGGAQELGQSITAPCTGSLDSLFVIYQPRVGTAGQTAEGRVTWYEGDGTAGTLLATIPFSFTIPAEGFAYTLDLGVPDVAVTEGSVYTYFVDLDGTSSLAMHAANTNPYAGGQLHFSATTSPTGAIPQPTLDLRFILTFAEPAVTEPEPVSLIITGVVDGPLPGGLPKAVEVFVLEDIADLSLYALGSANNGGGTDGAEFVFPDTSATAGDFLYVAAPGTDAGSGLAAFVTYFGFAPDYISEMANINGDDAIELFFDANADSTFDATEVADIFGDINVDGTGQAWDYLDGWAYRANGTGPDSTTFMIENWIFSGIDALDGTATNAQASNPFPIGSYLRNPVAGEPTPSAPFTLVVANPVTGTATVRYALPTAEAATLALYSVTGRRVATLAEGAASGTATLDARGLAAGVYVLRLESGGTVATRLVTVVR